MYYLHNPKFIKSLLKARHKQSTEHLLSQILFSAPQHWYGAGYAFPASWFERLGHKKQTFAKLNKQLNLFVPTDYYSQGYAKLWIPTENTLEIVQSYPLSPVYDTKTDAPMRKPSRVLAPYSVHINQEGLDEFIAHGYQTLEPKPDSTLSREEIQTHWLNHAKKLKTITNNSSVPGAVPTKYRRIENGRIVGVGISVQNIRKEVRGYLLEGWDYDMANCHFDLASQMGRFPYFSDYASDPIRFRTELAEDVGVTPKVIKTALLSRLNGAHGAGETLDTLLGPNRQAFIHHKLVKGVSRDIKKFTNEFGAPANVLMHQESRCLDAVTKHKKIDVPFFDGFLSSNDYSTEEIENVIFEETNFHLKITKKPACGIQVQKQAG